MTFKTTSPRYLDRIRVLCHKMLETDCGMCIFTHPSDLLYFTGLQLSTGTLLVHPQESLLLVDGRYLQIALEQVPMKVELESKETLTAFYHRNQPSTLYFDGRYTSYDQFIKLETWKKELPLRQQELQLLSKSRFFQPLRAIKDAEELDTLAKSAHLLWKGFEHLKTLIKPGVEEILLAKQFELFCLQEGADRLAFEPIIAFGAHTAMPHHRSGRTSFKEGDIVLIDIGVVVENYHSDMTRVLFFQHVDPFLETLYTVVKRAHQAALNLCRPGVAVGELDRAARHIMAQENLEDLFVHSLGHGIGLQTHEFPRIKTLGEDDSVLLEPGMVFTIEPGLYAPGKGGVRYEDTIIITSTGYRNLYPDLS